MRKEREMAPLSSGVICDYMILEFQSNGYLSGCSCHLSGDLSHA